MSRGEVLRRVQPILVLLLLARLDLLLLGLLLRGARELVVLGPLEEAGVLHLPHPVTKLADPKGS